MNTKNFPEYAADAARKPCPHFRRYTASGKNVAGYTCSYVPEELLYAAGFLPVRLIGRAQNVQKVDKYIQTYCCSQIRSLMEDFLNSAYDGLDGVIFAHTCDSMQSFHDIFKKNFPDMFVANVNFPARVDTEIAFKYAAAELRRFATTLGNKRGAPISTQEIEKAVAVCNRNRELLDHLYSLHLQQPDKVPSVMLLHSVLASMFLDKNELNPFLSAYIESLGDAGAEDSSRKRIMLVGSININEDVYTLADEFGAMIADDDMCTGRRYFEGLVTEPTIEGITRRYFDRPNCAAKHAGLRAREKYILGMIEKKKIDGVIFLYLKFCDPHSFDYPDIKKALDGAKIPSQLIEIEQAAGPSGQIRTKMQAFLEMIG